MKKIKSVKFNGLNLLKSSNKYWEYFESVSFSEDYIANPDNKHLFEITYEDEKYELEIPSYEELKHGYVTDCACPDIHDVSIYQEQQLVNLYKTGFWFPTREQAVKKLRQMECITYCKKLAEKCNEENKEENLEYVSLYYYDYKFEIGYFSNYYGKIIILSFSSKKSAEQFLEQCSDEHLETLKEIYREGLI